MSLAADRCLGIALMGLAAFTAVNALSLEVPFSYDPVGPKAFPLGLSILLGLLSVVLVIRPGENGHWPDKRLALRLIGVLALLLVYALLFPRLGFAISSMLVIAALARLFEASWPKAIATGVLMAFGGQWLFTHGLGITLPGLPW
ncbi:tripartite tricarboxylate transporter TctB family protein [Halomonas cupida]|uniref:tripartite tricarboxylate transporter TctB family protein n=1 Tax=Halomonas TaxID=2745 RepID=UPI001A8D722F|nr:MULTISPECIES: tripartite tricarboxylate transporter TctB family protein [Halomonas]MBN8411726.1 tripartite tricarboxylate transporter TctB family protein [Halomonas litopenaei]MBY5927909.1 tripartite tricarboxylate transporter TctB family protein [Halomonas sp. DP8Y7-3]MBY6028954.1 tripartite tricarboxylate transporter TctB family protein [Halomonas sp. DP8Y7-1]